MPAEAVLAALQALLKTIAPLNVAVALIGGLALAIWKHPRFTKDVDVLVSLGDTPPDQLIQLLKEAGFRPKRGDGLVRIGNLRILQLLYQPSDAMVDVQVDLLLASDEYQLQALSRRVPTTIADFESTVDVISCEDLILHKLLAGRMIDLADAAALLKANRRSIDFSYLVHWVHENALRAEFARVWQEAFPGEPVPESGQ